MWEVDNLYVYAFFLSTSITFHDEEEILHLGIDLKTIYYKFYSGNKSLQCLGQYASFPSQNNTLVSLLFVIIISVNLRR